MHDSAVLSFEEQLTDPRTMDGETPDYKFVSRDDLSFSSDDSSVPLVKVMYTVYDLRDETEYKELRLIRSQPPSLIPREGDRLELHIGEEGRTNLLVESVLWTLYDEEAIDREQEEFPDSPRQEKVSVLVNCWPKSEVDAL